MKIFITSDMHFNHKTMINEKWRDFNNIYEMNEYIIERWNKVVDKSDTVYVLGDVCIGGYGKYKKEIEPRLNGQKIYIKGNHDSNSLTNIESININYKGWKIGLIHNPQYSFLSNADIILHGHQHKSGNHKFDLDKRFYYNVNLEFHNYKPKLLNEIVGEITNKRK